MEGRDDAMDALVEEFPDALEGGGGAAEESSDEEGREETDSDPDSATE